MPDALLSSKVIVTEEAPRIRSITALPTAILGLVGVTVRGPIGVARLYTSFETWRNVYGPASSDSLEAYASVQAFFEEGGQFLWFVRTVHYTDISDAGTLTATAASVMIQTVSPTAAVIVGVNAAPYNLEPGDDITIDVDNAGVQTATFAATASTSTSGNTENFALTNGNTLEVEIDSGDTQTVTFNTGDFVAIGAATAAEVAAVLNTQLVGCSAAPSAGAVVISSDRRGTSSLVEVVGGTDAAAFAFPAGVAGTGNVANIDAVTFAELKTVIEAAVSGLTVVEQTPAGSGIPDLTSDTTGVASEVEITASTNVQTAVGWAAGPNNGTAGSGTDTVEIEGKYEGAYANSITARIGNATNGEADRFDLSVIDNGFVVETFQNLSMLDTDANYIETVLDAAGTGSNLIRATDQDAVDPGRPTNGDYPLTTGNDGLAGLADTDFIGSSASDTGLRAFDVVPDLTLLGVPGRATSAVHNAMIQYAEVTRNKSIFCILEPPAATNTAGIIDYVENTAGLLGNTEHAAIYWPRVKILNPNKDVFGASQSVAVPNTGHVAGVFARTDASRPGGVYVPPAGTEQGVLRTITGLEDDPDGGERHQVFKEANRDLVYPKLINPISDEGGVLNLDGTRTLKSDGNFPGVAERRGVIFIEQSIKAALQFARHSNHTPKLRGEVDRAITKFLLDQMRLNAFRTTDPSTAFYVDVGTGLNTPSVVFSNQLLVRVGLGTNKSIDWVILKFTQDTRALEQELAQA